METTLLLRNYRMLVEIYNKQVQEIQLQQTGKHKFSISTNFCLTEHKQLDTHFFQFCFQSNNGCHNRMYLTKNNTFIFQGKFLMRPVQAHKDIISKCEIQSKCYIWDRKGPKIFAFLTSRNIFAQLDSIHFPGFLTCPTTEGHSY